MSNSTTAYNRTFSLDQFTFLQDVATLASPTAEPRSHNSAAFKLPPASIKISSIVSNVTHPQFRKFVIDWNVYKQMTGLPSLQIGPRLYNACNDTVQLSFVNSHPTFSYMDEYAMLEVTEKCESSSSLNELW